MSAWDSLITEAVQNSLRSLTVMSGEEIRSDLVNPFKIDVIEIPDSLGGADKVVVGVLLGVEHIPGFHIALVHSLST